MYGRDETQSLTAREVTVLGASAAERLLALGMVILTEEELASLEGAAHELAALQAALAAVGIRIVCHQEEDRPMYTWQLAEPQPLTSSCEVAGAASGLALAVYGALQAYKQGATGVSPTASVAGDGHV